MSDNIHLDQSGDGRLFFNTYNANNVYSRLPAKTVWWFRELPLHAITRKCSKSAREKVFLNGH